MPRTRLEIARALRPGLTRLYLLYFRKTEQSHISQAQLSIMMILDENGPLRINQIAGMESIRMPTASNAVNQLETMGLVTRVRDVSDRRGVRVQLTDRGQQELQSLDNARSQQLASMLDNLSEEELKKVDDLVPMIDLILSRYSMQADDVNISHARGASDGRVPKDQDA